MNRRFARQRLPVKMRLGGAIATTLGFNLLVIPRAGFDHIAAVDHIVRTALQHPIADRWTQRDGLAVEHHLPVRRGERGDDLLAASAAAAVGRCRVFHRYIENARLKTLRDVLDETMLKALVPYHARSPLINMLPSVV